MSLLGESGRAFAASCSEAECKPSRVTWNVTPSTIRSLVLGWAGQRDPGTHSKLRSGEIFHFTRFRPNLEVAATRLW